ncbi:hypothetical protein J4E89_002578 [Alternaria sp. Ai002NY15]|nr:hypothetical protein J4E89_002578 [Alternaria sp. Ai002NY15]
MDVSKPPLCGWVCHDCSHFNVPGTIASPGGPCQTCELPVCEAECADATVTTRDDRRCSGYACWYCKYFYTWPEDKDGNRMLGSALSCGICEDLEEEEVVFIKSWIEELDAIREKRTEQQEKDKDEKDEKEDKDAKLDDFDDGRGDFVVVNRRRARSNRGTGGGGIAQ